jgi:hypothetical protein
MRIGIIARCDDTGLGNQTRELVNMLNPDKVMLINSTFFNENKQHPEWYEGYNYKTTIKDADASPVYLSATPTLTLTTTIA